MSQARRASAVVVAVLASLVASLAVPRPAAANGIGDLYAGAQAGVLELHVESASVVARVSGTHAVTALAFSPDGRRLYAGSGTQTVVVIDIETLAPDRWITLPGTERGIAHGSGGVAAVALPDLRQVALVDGGTGAIEVASNLPGGVDLLAGDPRVARVVAAERGARWVAAIEGPGGAAASTRVAGSVTGVAVHPDGVAYVAMRSPNRLVRLSLRDLAVEWRVELPAAPTALAALKDRVVVAAGAQLLSVTRAGAKPWARASGVTSLVASSHEGAFLYAGGAQAVVAYDGDGRVQRTIPLAEPDRKPAVLAAVPATSSLAKVSPGPAPSGSPGPGTGAGTGTGTGLGLPDTATFIAAVRDLAVRSPLTPPLVILFGTAMVVVGLSVRRRRRA